MRTQKNRFWLHVFFVIAVLPGLQPGTVFAHADDDPVLFKFMLEQLEMRGSGNDSEDSWDVEAWLGKDLAKIWLKTDGDRRFGTTQNAEVQLLYSRAVSGYWDIQAGIRHDFEPSASRDWLAIGLSGLAPYFLEIDSAFFIGGSGRTALRFAADYDLLLTQRLVLTPEIEANFYGKNDSQMGIGSGLSDLEAGLRLRYEIRREFAPYLGINWSRSFGNTADYLRAASQRTSDTQFVIGLRAWF